MKVKYLKHIPLFEHLTSDQDEEELKELEKLHYFAIIVELARKHDEIIIQLGSGSWADLELGLTTCAYLGTDSVAKNLLAQALWSKTKAQLEPILDFQRATWQTEYQFLSKYLNLYFKIGTDALGKIDIVTRVEHCWTDREIHPTTISTANAAACGNLKTLIQLRANRYPWDENTCKCAAQNGHLHCLTYAHEKGSPWDVYTCRLAAGNGHLPCLTYAHENGCPWDADTCRLAAGNGHLACLTYAHEKGCPWDEHTCLRAAENGFLECLKYAHENACPWDAYTCTWASRNVHLECLTYAHENGCPWDSLTCTWAAQNGQIQCLTYARENGCKFLHGS